jgi:N6-adenosine-specific RNA methylase IME4
VLQLKRVVGKFRTIVIDPAWEYDWLSLADRARPGYAMQTHEELLALDVRAWADEICHLYCWVPNNFMARACELVKHWGLSAPHGDHVDQATAIRTRSVIQLST